MYIYIYIYIYTHVYIYLYIYTCISIYMCMYICIHIYLYIHVYVNIYLHMWKYPHMFINSYTYVDHWGRISAIIPTDLQLKYARTTFWREKSSLQRRGEETRAYRLHTLHKVGLRFLLIGRGLTLRPSQPTRVGCLGRCNLPPRFSTPVCAPCVQFAG